MEGRKNKPAKGHRRRKKRNGSGRGGQCVWKGALPEDMECIYPGLRHSPGPNLQKQVVGVRMEPGLLSNIS